MNTYCLYPFKSLKDSGFTLIEGVLSIAIIGVGMVGLLFAFQGTVSSSLLADQSIVASNIAREAMEKIIAQRDCDEVGCGYAATLTAINAQNRYDENPVSGFPSYSLDSEAMEVNPNSDSLTDDFLDERLGSGYARVTVSVTWNGGKQSTRLVTLITDY